MVESHKRKREPCVVVVLLNKSCVLEMMDRLRIVFTTLVSISFLVMRYFRLRFGSLNPFDPHVVCS